MSENAKQRRLVPVGEPTVQEVEKEPTPLDLLRTEAITAGNYRNLPPLRWFVPGWIIANGTTQVYGPPKAGKSFWTMRLALEAARGGQWCNHDFRTPRRVLYIAPEASRSHVERVTGWAQMTGAQWPATLTLLPSQMDISKDIAGVRQYVTEEGPFDLVVIDTLASASPSADENTSEMKVVTANLETIRRALPDHAALIIVHHTGKDMSKGGRGHSSLLGYVSGAILITKETGTGNHKAAVQESRDGLEPLPLHYRIEPVQLPPISGELLAREVGVMVEIDYVEAVKDNVTTLYDALKETYPHPTTFTARDAQEASGLRKSANAQTLTRGVGLGLWVREGTGPKTVYRLVPRPSDIGPLVETAEADTAAQLFQ